MTTCHLLPHIEQQGITPVGRHGELSLEGSTCATFATTALGGGYVDDFLFTRLAYSRKG